MAYNHGHPDWNTTTHFNTHVEHTGVQKVVEKSEVEAGEDSSSSEETEMKLEKKAENAVVAFRNNCYGSKVVKPPIQHCHMDVCPGYTSTANHHLLNRFSLCGQPSVVCCPHCKTVDYSHVHSQAGTSTVFWVCFVGLISACLLSWIPCFCKACKDHHHICSHCGMLLAYDRKC